MMMIANQIAYNCLMQKQVVEEVGVSEEKYVEEVKDVPSKIVEGDDEEPPKVLNGVTIFCNLCKDYLVHSVTTTCEHTFCELCLTQYILYLDQCPDCRNKIRNQKQASNILLDNLILDYIKKYDSQELEAYEKRLEEYKDNKKRRTVGELQAGMLVDVRDLDFVWCTGKVHRTINKFHDRKVKYVIVKYDKSTKKEEIPESSARLAPRGFFSEREDIPRYERGKLVLKSPEEGVCYQLIQQSSEESQQQEKR